MLAYDFGRAPVKEGAQFAAGIHDRLTKFWDIHMRVNIPPMNAVFGLEEFLGMVVGPDAVTQSRLMLQGFDNKSVALGRALWELSRWVREDELFASLAVSDRRRGQGLARTRSAEFTQRWQAFPTSAGARTASRYGWPSGGTTTTPLMQLTACCRTAKIAPTASRGRPRPAGGRDGGARRRRQPSSAMLPLPSSIPIAEDQLHHRPVDHGRPRNPAASAANSPQKAS
jgi:hypothetical protein